MKILCLIFCCAWLSGSFGCKTRSRQPADDKKKVTTTDKDSDKDKSGNDKDTDNDSDAANSSGDRGSSVTIQGDLSGGDAAEIDAEKEKSSRGETSISLGSSSEVDSRSYLPRCTEPPEKLDTSDVPMVFEATELPSVGYMRRDPKSTKKGTGFACKEYADTDGDNSMPTCAKACPEVKNFDNEGWSRCEDKVGFICQR